jgi:hypothetical protein
MCECFAVPKDVFFAEGYLGQRIIIIPSQDLLIVHMGLGSQTENLDSYFGPLFASISALFPNATSSGSGPAAYRLG